MDIIGNLMEEIKALFHHSAAQSGGATQPTASHARKLNQGTRVILIFKYAKSLQGVLCSAN